MRSSEIFISSCSRRQLARRRPSHGVLRLQLTLTLLVILSGMGAFMMGRGGF